MKPFPCGYEPPIDVLPELGPLLSYYNQYHWEGKTSLGALGGVFEEGGSRPDGCIKFLPSIGPSGASFGVRNMSLDGNDAAKAVGVTRGCIESGGEDVGA